MGRALEVGITTDRVIPGVVSEFEERQAARFANLSWPEYNERWPLDTHVGRWERAATIAFYRVDSLVAAHIAQARDQDAKSQAAARRRTSGGPKR